MFEHFHGLLEQYVAAVDLAGLIVAVTTPFDANGEIDRTAFITHLEFLARHGVKRVLVGGTTGEFFSLLPDERKLLLTLARRYFPGVVLFQVGSDSLAMTLEAVTWAEKYGADAVVSLPPYCYNGICREGLVKYFRKVSAATELPLILYNFPKHTQNPLEAEMLHEIPHFGMKDSSADLGMIDATPHYYVGGDKLIVESYARGGYGFVSGLASVFPEVYVTLDQACRSGNSEAARRTQAKICELVDKFSGSLIPKIKQALNERLPDYPPNVRLPLM